MTELDVAIEHWQRELEKEEHWGDACPKHNFDFPCDVEEWFLCQADREQCLKRYCQWVVEVKEAERRAGL